MKDKPKPGASVTIDGERARLLTRWESGKNKWAWWAKCNDGNYRAVRQDCDGAWQWVEQ